MVKKKGLNTDKKHSKRTSSYQTYLVTYIDIMGFKDLVRRSKKDSQLIVSILNSFRETNNVGSRLIKRTPTHHKVKLHFFSDCVVRLIPLKGLTDWDILGVIDFELFQLALIQTYLIEQGVFIRGCMNKGRLCNQEDIFFGKAFNDAYQYESEKAVTPIIVLSSSLVKYLKGTSYNKSFECLTIVLNKSVNNYNHPLTYLNYLNFMIHDCIFETPEHKREFLLSHKTHVHEAISEHSENVKVLMKYLWLKEYHNHYVSRFEDNDIDGLLI